MVIKILSHILFVTAIATAAQAKTDFRFVVLDVGEGQSILIQREKSGILIDTGHFGKSYDVVQSIKKYGVEKIDFIFLSHFDPDHASGIFRVMESYPKAVVYETGQRVPFTSQPNAYRWVVRGVDAKKWQVKYILQGGKLEWHGVTLQVLWPRQPSGISLNAQSLVISLEYGGVHFLVMGDAGRNEEAALLQENKLLTDIDVLVVGHHGAGDATSAAFLNHIKPKHAVISVDNSNVNGYPDANVVRRLASSGARLHFTGKQGDFHLKHVVKPSPDVYEK